MNFISEILGFFIAIWGLVEYFVIDVIIILQIILNPFLLLMILFTMSHFYVILNSKSKMEIISNYFVFMGRAGAGIYNLAILTVPFIMGIIQGVIGIIQGIIAAPAISILGTSIGIGTILAIGMLITILSILTGPIDLGLIDWISGIINDVTNWF